MKLKIAFLQLTPTDDPYTQLGNGIKACQQAQKAGADIALFPEMWSNGYKIPQNEQQLDQSAISSKSTFISAFQQAAQNLDMAIAITFLEKHLPRPQNSMILFDRHGRKVLHYSKIHTCDFGDERKLDPGQEFYVNELDTVQGKIKVGSMICYDREFPESARILMIKGAELILVPNACPMEINRLAQLRSRAFENMCAIATCNYPITKSDCNGHSTLFDGVAYSDSDPISRDMKIFEAGEKEGIYLANLNVDQLRKYRQSEVQGNAYRRPEKYHELIDTKINPPFVRKDRRK